MRYKIIASGSKGNLTYLETKEGRFLIDAGISHRELIKRYPEIKAPIDAILISHEHGDHVKGLAVIAKKFKAPIYITKEAYQSYELKYNNLKGLNIFIIEANSKYKIKDLQVFTLNLSHDTSTCLGFIFASHKKSLAYITDTGFLPIPYIDLLKKVNHLIIESNHDIAMLNESDRPWNVKQRTLSVKGHMSNYISAQIIASLVAEDHLQHITLAHLSELANTEELAVDTLMDALAGKRIPIIKVAKQDVALEMIEIEDEY